MAKAQKNALEISNDAQENLSTENVKASAADILAEFAKVDKSNLKSLSTEYLQLKEDSTYDLVFAGLTDFTGDNGGKVPAVELIDEEGNTFINGNTVLVNCLRKVRQMPCLVRIVTAKMHKSANGQKYLNMEVLVLSKAATGE